MGDDHLVLWEMTTMCYGRLHVSDSVTIFVFIFLQELYREFPGRAGEILDKDSLCDIRNRYRYRDTPRI